MNTEAYQQAIYAALDMINEAQNKRLGGGRVDWMKVTAAVTEELQWALGVNDLPTVRPDGEGGDEA